MSRYCFLIVFVLLVSAQKSHQRLNTVGVDTTATFEEARREMGMLRTYTFGAGSDRTIRDLRQLATFFDPYGIAGTTVINQEWQRYQPFNVENFVFTEKTLNLTATIPEHGGLSPGGIHSGQIWTKETFRPGFSGHSAYAFEVRMRVPSGRGMWPAEWFYTKSAEPGMNDGSEIDNPEFFNMRAQNQFDWTGFQHGPGRGRHIYSITAANGIWHPQFDFSADYHSYQTFWTSEAVYKYVDGKLIDAQLFTWTSPGSAQLGISLAVGSSNSSGLTGLQPTSVQQFPSIFSIEHLYIWGRNQITLQ